MPDHHRTILHLDLDAFYAAVEQQDHPELRGRPVIVGGSLQRGVVSACSYEARTFGVHSAMAMTRAVRLCPQAVVLPVRMRRYQQASAEVFAIFARYTDRLEPLSIDEAFLDVTGCERLFGPPLAIAGKIRAEVRRELGLAVSAGVAPNKFLAKLASEAAKPDGVLEVRPEAVDDFLLPLPVGRLWGVGKITADRLRRLGLETVADLRQVDRPRLRRWFGAAGEQLWALARGEDERPVTAVEAAKSIGCEETFARDLVQAGELQRELLALAERTGRRLRQQQMTGRCLTLKVRYADFETVTRSQTLAEGTDHAPELLRLAMDLLAKTEAGPRPVRLLGLGLSRLAPREGGQHELFPEAGRRLQSLDRAVDQLYRRFGTSGICRASLLMAKSDATGHKPPPEPRGTISQKSGYETPKEPGEEDDGFPESDESYE